MITTLLGVVPEDPARRGHLLAADCPSRDVMQHVTGRWGVLVLMVLLKGSHRFSELRRTIGGVSEKMLAQTLQALEGDGFVLRTSHPEVPPRVEYRLTPMGIEVAQMVEALADWIEGSLPRIQRHRALAAASDADGLDQRLTAT